MVEEGWVWGWGCGVGEVWVLRLFGVLCVFDGVFGGCWVLGGRWGVGVYGSFVLLVIVLLLEV